MRESSQLLLLAVLLAGCSNTETLSVFAASSLTETFRALEQELDGGDVALTFAGSQVLRLQIEQGAPADVYASGDPSHMRALVEAGLAQGDRALAFNELVVVVPPDNPAQIESFEDLPRARRLVHSSGTRGYQLTLRAEHLFGGPVLL